MRNFILFISLTVNYCCTFSQNSFSDIKKENLNGHIKSLKESYFELEKIYKEIENEEGYPDLKIIDIKKGKPKGTDEYIGFKNFYNERGFIKEYYQFYLNRLSGKVKYRLNKNDQKMDLINYDFVKGEFVKAKKYYSYNFFYYNNKVIEKSINLKTGKLYSISIIKFNKLGRIIESSTKYLKNNRKSKQEFSYDLNNNLISRISYSNNEIISKSKFTNDNNGNCLSLLIYNYKNNSSRKFEYMYTYDHQNNWIEKITIIDGIQDNITEREISYY